MLSPFRYTDLNNDACQNRVCQEGRILHKARYRTIKIFTIFLVLCSIVNLIDAQDQRITDSVYLLLEQGPPTDSVHIDWLKILAQNETDPLKSEQFADQLIKRSQEPFNYKGIIAGYTQKGNANRLLGNLEESLIWYFKGIEIAKENEDLKSVGGLFISIADAYGVSGNRNNAIIFYNRGIENLRLTTDSIALGSALFNCGDEYIFNEVYDTALIYFQESGVIFERVNFLLGTGYNLGNMGKVYAHQGKTDLALESLNKSIEILEEFEDYYPISVYLIEMSEISLSKGQPIKAIEYAERSLQLAEDYSLKEQIGEAHYQLSKLYEGVGNFNKAFVHQKSHIIYRDSLSNIESVEKLANLRTDFEVSEKQLEVDLLNEQKKAQRVFTTAVSIALVLIGLLALGLYRRFLYIRQTNRIIEKERNRSDELLLNILPAETAEELKEFGSAKAKNYGSVTVLFTDFKEFTLHSERLEPEVLVSELDHCFKAFDHIMGRNNVEKIKTVGDAYLAAAGLPVANISNPEDAVHAALDVRDFMLEYYKKRADEGREGFEIRIGINTGSLVAGIVGIKKFQYDIWGDTVNIASRMESNGEVGKVNVSQNTYEHLKDNKEFVFTPRGKIKAKHKGEIEMYFVERAS